MHQSTEAGTCEKDQTRSKDPSGSIRNQETGIPALVFPYLQGVDYITHFTSFSLFEIKCILFQLFEALDYAHRNGIIHRDVKPQNIILQYPNTVSGDSSSLGDDGSNSASPRRYPELWLIDWGLAEFYIPGKEFNVRVASRYYKAPELLVSLQDYDYSLDMFSAGCLLGSLLFGKEPLFKGEDNQDQLVKICKVLGTEGLKQYLDRYGLDLPEVYEQSLKDYPRVPWSAFIKASNRAKCTNDALDLLTQLLQYDHQLRPTAKEAMAHPFFDEVRDLVSSNTRMKFDVANLPEMTR
mgnify:FL=1